MLNNFSHSLAGFAKNIYAGFISDFFTLRYADAPPNLVRDKCAAKIVAGFLSVFAGAYTSSSALLLGGAYNFVDVIYSVLYARKRMISKTVAVDVPLRLAGLLFSGRKNKIFSQNQYIPHKRIT